MIINLKGLADYGVHIALASDPARASQLTELFAGRLSPQVRALVPLSVFITNKTNKEIIAYTIRWKAANEQPIDVTSWNLETLQGGPFVIPPGHSRFASLVWGLEQMPLEVMSQHDKETRNALANFSGGNITISIDSVVFADGSSCGTDDSSTFGRIEEIIGLERNLVSAVRSKVAEGTTVADVADWLKRTASEPTKPSVSVAELQLRNTALRLHDANRRGGQSQFMNALAAIDRKGVFRLRRLSQ